MNNNRLKATTTKQQLINLFTFQVPHNIIVITAIDIFNYSRLQFAMQLWNYNVHPHTHTRVWQYHGAC